MKKLTEEDFQKSINNAISKIKISNPEICLITNGGNCNISSKKNETLENNLNNIYTNNRTAEIFSGDLQETDLNWNSGYPDPDDGYSYFLWKNTVTNWGNINGKTCKVSKHKFKYFKINCELESLEDVTELAIIGPFEFFKCEMPLENPKEPCIECDSIKLPEYFSDPVLECSSNSFYAMANNEAKIKNSPKINFSKKKPQTLEEQDPDGPGTKLSQMLEKIGIKSSPTCSCKARARLMNEKGYEWCEQNVDTIVGWLREEATKRKLPFVNIAGKILIKRAISLSKKAKLK
jgi:hypothetical protein